MPEAKKEQVLSVRDLDITFKTTAGASLVAKVRLFAILLPFSPSSRTQICIDFLFNALHLYCAKV